MAPASKNRSANGAKPKLKFDQLRGSVVGAAEASGEESEASEADEQMGLTGGGRVKRDPSKAADAESGGFRRVLRSRKFGVAMALAALVLLATVGFVGMKSLKPGKRSAPGKKKILLLSRDANASASSGDASVLPKVVGRPLLPGNFHTALEVESPLVLPLPDIAKVKWTRAVVLDEDLLRLGLTFLPPKVRELCLSGGSGPPSQDFEAVKTMLATSCGYVSSPDSPVQRNLAFFRSEKEPAKTGSLVRMLYSFSTRHNLKVVSGTNLEDSGNKSKNGRLFWYAGCATKRMLTPGYRGLFNIEARPVMDRETGGPTYQPKQYRCADDKGQFFDKVTASYQALIEEPFIMAGFSDPAELMRSSTSYWRGRTKMKTGDKVWYVYEPMMQDFGLGSVAQLKSFVNASLWSGKVFPIIMEKLDESLITLRRALNLPMVDLMYPLDWMRREEARQAGLSAAAGLFEEGRVGEAEVVKAKEDGLLYDAARNLFDAIFDKHMDDAEGKQELLVFRSMLRHFSPDFCQSAVLKSDSSARADAVQDLCWLLAKDHTEREMLNTAQGLTGFAKRRSRKDLKKQKDQT